MSAPSKPLAQRHRHNTSAVVQSANTLSFSSSVLHMPNTGSSAYTATTVARVRRRLVIHTTPTASSTACTAACTAKKAATAASTLPAQAPSCMRPP